MKPVLKTQHIVIPIPLHTNLKIHAARKKEKIQSVATRLIEDGLRTLSAKAS